MLDLRDLEGVGASEVEIEEKAGFTGIWKYWKSNAPI